MQNVNEPSMRSIDLSKVVSELRVKTLDEMSIFTREKQFTSYEGNSYSQIELKSIGIDVNAEYFSNGNLILVEVGASFFNVKIRSPTARRSVIVLCKSDYLSCDVSIEADECFCFVGDKGWNKFDCRLRDDGCTFVLGNHCSIGGASIWVEGVGRSVKIGNGCLLAWNIQLRTGDSHGIITLDGQLISRQDDIYLQKRVWIGEGALICKGVEIGVGAIVGSKSVVTKSVRSCTLAAGNPAKLLKTDVTWTSPRYPTEGDIRHALNAVKIS